MSDLYNNTIEQLKRIKFALLILTTTILVISLLTGKNKIETAIEDLKNLKRTLIIPFDNASMLQNTVRQNIEKSARELIKKTGHNFKTVKVGFTVRDSSDSDMQKHVISFDAYIFLLPSKRDQSLQILARVIATISGYMVTRR